MGQCEASKKFWESPELLEKLLPFLDPETTLHLAKTHKMTRAILQKSYIWKKLIRRSCPYGERELSYEQVQSRIDLVKGLVAILKLLKDPKALLPDLLDLICERFTQDERFFRHPQITVGCPCPAEHHSISLTGFLLLEEGDRSSTLRCGCRC